MNVFSYVVSVACDTVEQADMVMAERLSHDEDYGFSYTVVYSDGADGVERVDRFYAATEEDSADDEFAAAWDVAAWVDDFRRPAL